MYMPKKKYITFSESINQALDFALKKDKIYVIDKGNVANEGKHNELLETSDIYRNFYEKQIKKS